jgi:zinc protease
MRLVKISLLLLSMVMPLTTPAQNKIFPYKYFTDDLPNGLRVITIPTDYPNIVALYIAVNTGSRNEVEPGKSGFAHLFEHLMFRGTDKFSADAYNEALKNAGADSNAYTSDDRTVYHTVFSKDDLDQIIMLEADRFQNLKVPIDLFKTETRAVLGEYNKNASSPVRKIYEALREIAFKSHTYQHTTMGFLRDVENMPNMYDYSLEFFKRYYRPEYVTIIVAGDVKHEGVMQLVNKYWAGWKRGNYTPEIPNEPEQTAPLSTEVAWPTPTLPWVAVAFKGPAYSDDQKDKPALDLIGSLGFSQTSDLYQKLVIKEQKVDTLGADFEDHRDPYLLTVLARVKDPKDTEYVKAEILKAFDSFKSAPVASDKLNAVKSNLKYGFALSLDNSEAIAANLAPYISLKRTPETLNKLYDLYAAITPQDIQQMARKYFVETKRTTVVLAHKEKQNASQK